MKHCLFYRTQRLKGGESEKSHSPSNVLQMFVFQGHFSLTCNKYSQYLNERFQLLLAITYYVIWLIKA